jgi:hypothetical protein
MPRKPATLFFRFPTDDDLTQQLWEPLFDAAEHWITNEDRALFALVAESYSLDDHQFVRVKPIWKSREVSEVLLPRQYLVGIFEGKLKSGDFGFTSQKRTRKQ